MTFADWILLIGFWMIVIASIKETNTERLRRLTAEYAPIIGFILCFIALGVLTELFNRLMDAIYIEFAYTLIAGVALWSLWLIKFRRWWR